MVAPTASVARASSEAGKNRPEAEPRTAIATAAATATIAQRWAGRIAADRAATDRAIHGNDMTRSAGSRAGSGTVAPAAAVA